ncbi:DEAD/DEAH box helicase [Methylicorpusculum sp.]|uniref:DEAD/DEAH box helicase n=1 Tax=Methylicorpusculum sp. TaxID=2713644 RepID=UPI002716CF22|nr:DEAD/DEAH box helicase [Methylicorpusculum sp.]MDO8846523.1 DEAD/DEAH box helicase [Methylicorpusculum sp.]
MSHWLLDSLQDGLELAQNEANKALLYKALLQTAVDIDFDLIERNAQALELVVLDLLIDGISEGNQDQLRDCAAGAFRLFRVLPDKPEPITQAEQVLRYCALAVIGDKGADATRMLREKTWPTLPLGSVSWGERTWATVLELWLRVIRKHGWKDRDVVLELIADLRLSQNQFEAEYLQTHSGINAKIAAMELIAFYHLAKAAEIMAYFLTDGVVQGSFHIRPLLDMHFDRALAALEPTGCSSLAPMTRLLAACAKQLTDNSIWTVTRAVNSRVTAFVRSLVDRGRGDKVLFDVLPPQRRALAEQGLLGSSRRAVVVSLPTSSGKTLIAQFRILQALNQFEPERGWVAYIAPTKALVNQVARRLRRDFEPLGVSVEQVSPALEIDGIETKLLHEQDERRAFRVLVTTPEKLDLMLRQDLETKVGRPLTLVVVDEAHTLQDKTRGLRLELLLATINKECQHAQFLLLTPFIKNAREVARWLGGANSQDISLSLDWQPNDRVIGIVNAEKIPNGKRHSYQLQFKPKHTTRKTLSIDAKLALPKEANDRQSYSQINNQSSLAALTAQSLKQRGSIILMHVRPDWVWTLADKLKLDCNHRSALSKNIRLVQDFLRLEYDEGFPLIDLLNYGIGVHHSGLSDETRVLMEWLIENNEIDFLAATTTIAQGVNFPVAGVVMAAHQYPYGQDMPPEDFWNIAGRAGRVDQGSLGVVALVADKDDKVQKLAKFIDEQSGDLNSALIGMVSEAEDLLADLGGIVYRHPEWSSFLQYLTHTYRQMDCPPDFIDKIEEILRGTFGFEHLRHKNLTKANTLLSGIRSYIDYFQQSGQPLKLVDSTGFSLQSIRTALKAVNEQGIKESVWNSETLFQKDNTDLQKMMGVLLKVPELRGNLNEVTGGQNPDGQKLALILKDWVNGIPVQAIAKTHFADDITKCGQNLFGKLTQTASWGLGALLSMTAGELEEDSPLRNLPSRAYYGVNDDNAIALRLLGVPRMAAIPLANTMGAIGKQSLSEVRDKLSQMEAKAWVNALGNESGRIYYAIWKQLES